MATILKGYSEMLFNFWHLGPVSTMRNFVWFAKKICQREAISSVNDFLHSPKFLQAQRNFR